MTQTQQDTQPTGTWGDLLGPHNDRRGVRDGQAASDPKGARWFPARIAAWVLSLRRRRPRGRDPRARYDRIDEHRNIHAHIESYTMLKINR